MVEVIKEGEILMQEGAVEQGVEQEERGGKVIDLTKFFRGNTALDVAEALMMGPDGAEPMPIETALFGDEGENSVEQVKGELVGAGGKGSGEIGAGEIGEPVQNEITALEEARKKIEAVGVGKASEGSEKSGKGMLQGSEAEVVEADNQEEVNNLKIVEDFLIEAETLISAALPKLERFMQMWRDPNPLNERETREFVGLYQEIAGLVRQKKVEGWLFVSERMGEAKEERELLKSFAQAEKAGEFESLVGVKLNNQGETRGSKVEAEEGQKMSKAEVESNLPKKGLLSGFIARMQNKPVDFVGLTEEKRGAQESNEKLKAAA